MVTSNGAGKVPPFGPSRVCFNGAVSNNEMWEVVISMPDLQVPAVGFLLPSVLPYGSLLVRTVPGPGSRTRRSERPSRKIKGAAVARKPDPLDKMRCAMV